MADEKEKEGVKSTLSSWIKGIVTSIFGLLSGAILMYLTPLVNNAIKPAKPVSNFAAQIAGLNVNFNNRSTGATSGWWDFGDGSALEPFDPKVETISHAYKKPGNYSVKLSLQNLLGDASDRSAAVTIEADDTPKMDVDSFTLDAVGTSDSVYRLEGKVTGATYCILCPGDGQPMQIIDNPGRFVRFISFNQMGAYTVHLAAINGKQVLEKSKEVYVSGSVSTDLLAKLKLTYEAVRVERAVKTWHIHCGWQPGVTDPTCTFRKERPLDDRWRVVNIEVVNKDSANAPRDLDCQPSPDKKRIVLTGELTRPTGMLAPTQTAPSWVAEVKVTMERRSPTQFVNRDVTMPVSPGRTTKIPLQPMDDGYEIVRMHSTVELWDPDKKIWSGDLPVANAQGLVKGQPCTVNAVQQSDGVLLTVTTGGVPAVPVVLPKPAPMPMLVAPQETPPLPNTVQPLGPIRRTGFEFNPRHPFSPDR